MIGPEPKMAGWRVTFQIDEVEIYLLLPMSQLAALEAVAARSERTVGALLRGIIGDFLQSSSA